jgi:hypothetical protein
MIWFVVSAMCVVRLLTADTRRRLDTLDFGDKAYRRVLALA